MISAQQSAGPVLAVQALRLFSTASSRERVYDFQHTAGCLYLRGCGELLSFLALNPKERSSKENQSITLQGMPLCEALRSGRAAIAPEKLPLPESTRLSDALKMSAHLIGLGAKEVQQALKTCELTQCAKLRLAELSDEQQRLAGFAHAQLSQPELYVFARPLSKLADSSKIRVAACLRRITQDKLWIISGENSCSVSESFAQEASAQLRMYEGHSLLIARADSAPPAGYWIKLKSSGPSKKGRAELRDKLMQAFQSHGNEVEATFNPSMILVKSSTPNEINSIANSTAIGIHPPVPVAEELLCQ